MCLTKKKLFLPDAVPPWLNGSIYCPPISVLNTGDQLQSVFMAADSVHIQGGKICVFRGFLAVTKNHNPDFAKQKEKHNNTYERVQQVTTRVVRLVL